jgi:hypothetical protein
MVGVQGIGGVAGPGGPGGQPPRNTKTVDTSTAVHDEVSLSREAKDTATAARLLAASDSPIRDESVARARENIEQGSFRLQQVVLSVAARVSRFISD